jgi:hypothetical protein
MRQCLHRLQQGGGARSQRRSARRACPLVMYALWCTAGRDMFLLSRIGLALHVLASLALCGMCVLCACVSVQLLHDTAACFSAVSYNPSPVNSCPPLYFCSQRPSSARPASRTASCHGSQAAATATAAAAMPPAASRPVRPRSAPIARCAEPCSLPGPHWQHLLVVGAAVGPGAAGAAAVPGAGLARAHALRGGAMPAWAAPNTASRARNEATFLLSGLAASPKPRP